MLLTRIQPCYQQIEVAACESLANTSQFHLIIKLMIMKFTVPLTTVENGALLSPEGPGAHTNVRSVLDPSARIDDVIRPTNQPGHSRIVRTAC